MLVVLPLTFVGILLFAVYTQRTGYAFQYLYFLRFPILLGRGLIFLFLAGYGEQAPLQNLFVLDSWDQAVSVGFLATLVSWVVMYTSLLMWTRLPTRMHLFWSKNRSQSDCDLLRVHGQFDGDEKTRENPLPKWMLDAPEWQRCTPFQLRAWKRLLCFNALAVILVGFCLWQSKGPEAVLPSTQMVAGAIGGVLAAWLFVYVSGVFRKWLDSKCQLSERAGKRIASMRQ